jgi:hypothetical protein
MEKTTSLAEAVNQQEIPYRIDDISGIMNADKADQLFHHIKVSGGWDKLMNRLRRIKDKYQYACFSATAADIHYIEILNTSDRILEDIEFLDELIFLGEGNYRYGPDMEE